MSEVLFGRKGHVSSSEITGGREPMLAYREEQSGDVNREWMWVFDPRMRADH